MKKLLVIFVILIMVFEVKSQNIKIGPCIGGNYSIYNYGDLSKYYKAPIGFNVGIVSDIPISKSFSFSPELNYEQKNTSCELTETTSISKQKYSFINLVTPIKYYFGGNKQFYGYIGTYYSYLLKWELDINENCQDLTKDAKRSIIGFNVGAGFIQQISRRVDLMIDCNYGESIFFIGESDLDDEGKYKSVRLNVGILFELN